MIDNETMKSILSRRSCKRFDGSPIGDEELETIITAGLYAPTGAYKKDSLFTGITTVILPFALTTLM